MHGASLGASSCLAQRGRHDNEDRNRDCAVVSFAFVLSKRQHLEIPTSTVGLVYITTLRQCKRNRSADAPRTMNDFPPPPLGPTDHVRESRVSTWAGGQIQGQNRFQEVLQEESAQLWKISSVQFTSLSLAFFSCCCRSFSSSSSQADFVGTTVPSGRATPSAPLWRSRATLAS